MFDVIMMNPPYLKRTWLKFVERCIMLNPKFIGCINPDPMNTPSVFGDKWKTLCKDNGLIYREDSTHYFPSVTSGSIGSFVLDRSKQADGTLLGSSDTLYNSIYNKVITGSQESFAILGPQAVSGYGPKDNVHSLKSKPDDKHLYKSILSCRTEGLIIKYSDKKVVYKKYNHMLKGRFVVMNRFYGKNNPDPVFIIEDIENYNLSFNVIAFKLNEDETLDNFTSVYSSKLYRFILTKLRNGMFDIQAGQIMKLTRLNLTHSWTNEDIYKHFNLTDEEIEYIETNV
jgi:hypothetical protein